VARQGEPETSRTRGLRRRVLPQPDLRRLSPWPRHPISVRVVEYTIKDPDAKTVRYRLLTTITDPDQTPAAELAALYAQR
jgi:hypothetical protein